MSKQKRILLVSDAFYPEISPRSFRTTELARELYRQGYDVTVISKYRNTDYNTFLQEYPIHFRMWRKHILPEVPVIKKKPLSYLTRAISRFLSVLFMYPVIEEMFHVRKELKKEQEYDLMISFAVPYPVHWGVAWARSKRHRIARTWVADCGDPFMGNRLDTFKPPFYFRFLEKWFSRKADFITIPLETAKKGYFEEFHNKMRVVPQGFDFDLNERKTGTVKNEVPTFAYAGGFLPGARDPKDLLEFLAVSDKQFRFHVFTKNQDVLAPYRSKLGDKMIISDYIPREELMKILSSMDFLINFDNNTTLNSPSKLIDYAITGRPVLNITNKFKKEDIYEFLEGDYKRKMELPDPEVYHISRIAEKFLELTEPNSG